MIFQAYLSACTCKFFVFTLCVIRRGKYMYREPNHRYDGDRRSYDRRSHDDGRRYEERRSQDRRSYDDRRYNDRNIYSGRRKKRNKNRFTLILFCIALILGITAIIVVSLSRGNNKSVKKSGEPPITTIMLTTGQETQATTADANGNTQGTTVQPTSQSSTEAKKADTQVTDGSESTDPSSWNLKLVNLNSPKLAENYVPPLENINGYYLRKEVVKPAKKLMSGAESDGIHLFIVSGYRSYQTQTDLFNNRVALYEGQGMSHDEAYKKAAMVNAVPGTSEHQLGLAIDFNSLDQDFGETKEGKWLYNNAWKYGFVFRYPKESVGVTGIMYEPWHYRYVGVNNAKFMHDNNMTLEAYIEYLNKNKQ